MKERNLFAVITLVYTDIRPGDDMYTGKRVLMQSLLRSHGNTPRWMLTCRHTAVTIHDQVGLPSSPFTINHWEGVVKANRDSGRCQNRIEV